MPVLWCRTIRLRELLCTWPILIGIVAVLPYLSLLLTGELVFADSPYCDYSSFQVPMREFAQREFAAGRFPHWNPWVGCGIPMHATQQVALCYPLLTPLLFVFSANMAIKASLLLHVVLCYAGQYRLARRLNVTSAGAAVSGLIVAQSGFLTSHLAVGHVAMVLDYGILPWFLLSVVAICRRPSWSATLGFAITVAGLLLIGHPQVPYYAFVMGGLWAAGSLLCGAAATRRWQVCGGFISGLMVALLLASIQLVPAIELAQDNRGLSERGTVAYASQYALDCVDVYRLFFPSLRGNPLVEIPEFQPPDFFHEKVCYLGIITWLLIINGAFHPSADRWPRAALLLSTFALLVSLGLSTPLFAVIGKVIPGLFLFRCPGRCLGVAAVLLALLAGRGFDQFRLRCEQFTRPSNTRLIATLLVTDAALLLLLDQTLFGFDWARWSQFAGQRLLSELQMSMAIILASLAFIRWHHHVSERVRCLMVVAILLTDLGFFNVRGVRYQAEELQPLPTTVLADSDQFRFIEGPQSLRFSKDAVRYSRFVPQAVRSQVRMIGTNEGGVLPAACEVLFRALQDDPKETLRRSSCRDMVSNSKHPGWTRLVAPLPRMRFIPVSIGEDGTSPADDYIVIERLTDEPQLVVAQIKTPVSGEFVVADTFYPGWAATVDSEAAKINCVGGSFRGIQIPAGKHLIQMQFCSESFILGGRLTAVGSVGLVLLACLAFRERRLSLQQNLESSPAKFSQL